MEGKDEKDTYVRCISISAKTRDCLRRNRDNGGLYGNGVSMSLNVVPEREPPSVTSRAGLPGISQWEHGENRGKLEEGRQ